MKLTHFSKFQNETLFYIFYAMPKDALQVRDQLIRHNTYTLPFNLLPTPQLATQTHPPSRVRGGLVHGSAKPMERLTWLVFT